MTFGLFEGIELPKFLPQNSWQCFDFLISISLEKYIFKQHQVRRQLLQATCFYFTILQVDLDIVPKARLFKEVYEPFAFIPGSWRPREGFIMWMGALSGVIESD